MDLKIDDKMILDDSMLIESFECTNSEEDQHLYYYHFGKTGGTSVKVFLRALAFARGRPLGQIINREGKKLKPVRPEQLNPKPWVITGHAMYGYHEYFGDDLSLIGVIRDPVTRVLSEYFWKYRYKERGVFSDRSLFSSFLDQSARHNYLTSCLLGADTDCDHASELVINRLSKFKYVTTTEHMGKLLSVVASKNGSPSMVIVKAKVNPNTELRDALRAEFAAEIRERNADDEALYDYASDRSVQVDQIYRSLSANSRRKASLLAGVRPTDDSLIPAGKEVWIIETIAKQMWMCRDHEWAFPPERGPLLPTYIDLESVFEEKFGN